MKAKYRKPVKTEPKDVYRSCPGCGYVVEPFMASLMSYNFECPHCENYRVSDFRPLKESGINDPPQP